MKTPIVNPVAPASPVPAAAGRGSEVADAAAAESFGQLMARMGAAAGPRAGTVNASQDNAPKAAAGRDANPATKTSKQGHDRERQAEVDETPSAEADDALASAPAPNVERADPTASPASPAPVTALIEALLAAAPAAGGPVTPAAETADTSSTQSGASNVGATATTNASIRAGTTANEQEGALPSAPNAAVVDQAPDATPTTSTGDGTEGKHATRTAATTVSEVATAAPQTVKVPPAATAAQRAPGAPEPPDAQTPLNTVSSEVSKALQAQLNRLALPRDQPSPADVDARQQPAPLPPAMAPQRTPIAQALAVLDTQPPSVDTAQIRLRERNFEQLLGSRALSAPRAEPAQQAVPFAQLLPSPTVTTFDTIATAVGQSGFAQDLGHRVLMLVSGQVKSAELALTPAELGPVRVSIELRGHDASISFVAAAAATRLALEDALPRLREMFAQQGLNLLDTNIGAQAGHQGGNSYGQAGAEPDGRRNDNAASVAAHPAAAAPAAGHHRPTRLIDVIA